MKQELFNIGDEFKVTDEMEDGVKITLNKDAYIVVRYARSKAYLKGIVKINEDLGDDYDPKELIAKSIAEYGIVDIKNVTLPDGKKIENTTESKTKALLWTGKNHTEPPFALFVLRLMQDLGNFPGAGQSLGKIGRA